MPTPTGSASKNLLRTSGGIRLIVSKCAAVTPWLASILASRSIKVTTHLPTDTSVPTYMNSASASSRKDGLATSETASPTPDECDWVGAGKREVTISNKRTTVKAPSDQK